MKNLLIIALIMLVSACATTQEPQPELTEEQQIALKKEREKARILRAKKREYQRLIDRMKNY